MKNKKLSLPRPDLTTPILLFFLISSGLIFGAIAVDVFRHGTLFQADAVFSNWLASQSTPIGFDFFTLITWLGSATAITAGSLCLAFKLYQSKRWADIRLLVTAVVGSALMDLILKVIFHRPRPNVSLIPFNLSGLSFPSGHAMDATVFYGIIAYWIVVSYQNRKIQALAVADWIALAALIGFSRLYLGVHYLTDVLAGWSAGIFCLTLCILIEHYRSQSKEPKKEPSSP
jgi:membrane-associated phospholipid phosphatase